MKNIARGVKWTNSRRKKKTFQIFEDRKIQNMQFDGNEKISTLETGRYYRFSKNIVDSWLKDKIIVKKENTSEESADWVKSG